MKGEEILKGEESIKKWRNNERRKYWKVIKEGMKEKEEMKGERRIKGEGRMKREQGNEGRKVPKSICARAWFS